VEVKATGRMATFVLIHGAGGVGWYWHLVEAELRSRGHDKVAPDLPCDDDTAGLREYADAVVDAIGDRTGLVVVAQSFGGFTAPLVCDRVDVESGRTRMESAGARFGSEGGMTCGS
jgi:pimeloyl-ACP methyl ester carboxylesterase